MGVSTDEIILDRLLGDNIMCQLFFLRCLIGVYKGC